MKTQRGIHFAAIVMAGLTQAACAGDPPATRPTAQVDPQIVQVARQFRQYCIAPATGRGDRLLDDVELPKTSVSQAAKLMTTMRQDGSWRDIDYALDARSSWPAYNQLTRLLALTVYARRPETSPAESEKAIDAVHRGLQFWGKNDFICPNWWYNVIGTPKILGTIALLLDKDLRPLERDYITDVVMPRSKIGAMTGQNRVWIAGNNIMKAALTGDVSLMRQAAGIIADEVVLSRIQLGVPDEGIQHDWSFHQHGPQQQFGNYGMAFAIDITRWAIVLRDTRYAFPDEKIDILRHYLLEGLNWTCWNGVMDISACGRQLFPHSPRSKCSTISAVMQSMSLVDPSYARQYTAFVARNEHDAPNDLLGTQFFYKSDYLVHRSADLMSTLKMHSNRVIGGETVNSENVSGNHLPDGATFFYRSGKEYTDIFPVWNWRMIPGTTSLLDDSPLTWVKPRAEQSASGKEKKPERRKSDPTLPPANPAPTRPAKPPGTAFVGGASDGSRAAIAFDFHRDSLSAHKAWFYSNGMTLCMGAAISSTGSDVALTTLNQCLLHGDIRLNETLLHPPTDYIGQAKTIEHDGLEYYFPLPTEINLHAGDAIGNWKDVFETPSTPAADVTKPVFTLAISHGAGPQHASYVYAVAPTTDLPSLKLLPENRIHLLSNTPALQAAVFDDAVGAIFWSAGKLSTADHQIQVDHPCALLLTTNGGKLHLTIADPTQSLDALTITLDGKSKHVPLPAEPIAGKSVGIDWP
ncbi:MAG: polysaccharide lyase family 8 super-sandwich domain-containing protein [Phycisphaerae bacterium]